MIIDWKPDKVSKVPLFRQIVTHFEEEIKAGQYKAGTRLPSQRALSDQLDVNRSTIALAMDELKALELIETKGKGGTRVKATSADIGSFDWGHYVEESVYYPNRKIIQRINALDFDGDIIRLSSGAAMPESVEITKLNELIKDAAAVKTLDYTEPKGLLSLRRALCSYLKGIGIHVKPGEILIVSGALQAIQLIALGLLQRGSTALIEKPSYLYSLNTLKSLDMRRRGIACDEEGIIPEALYKARPRKHHSVLYTIPNYQNPTGRVMSLKRRRETLKVCEELNIPILEDDVYRELWLDTPPPPPLKSMESKGQVLYIGSVSKHLSPGLRIGWVVGPEAVIERLSDIKMQVDYGASTLSQIVTEKWLTSSHRQEAMSQIRDSLKRRRDVTLAALDEYMSDLGTWAKPEGGFYIWITLHKMYSEEQLFNNAIDAGVLIYPGHVYGNEGACTLRISYSSESEVRLKEGVRLLSEVIRHLE